MLGSVARTHRLGARIACALALAWAATGCGGPLAGLHGRPGATTGRPRPAPGYVGLRDSLGAADGSLLRGRRIVLDPGHGGVFRGCIGVGGLTEAEVNLGVAQQLDSLLRASGAIVAMTRTTDRDFLTPADSTLRSDLAARAAIANAFRPDLFLSIHHNADPSGAHDVNETQVYWQLGDDGPSYDAATDLQRSLARNVGIATQKLLPGNFAVVRGTDAPAVLTEASHLTNPDVEAKLRTPEARKLEAEALYVGIARYFARKRPVVERFDVARPSPQGAQYSLVGGFPVLTATLRGAFDDVSLRVDGMRVSPVRTGDSLWWTPRTALSSGPHVATLSARLAGEGASRTHRLGFRLAKSFARIAVDFPGQPGIERGGLVALRVRALDNDGLPLAEDSLAVRVHARMATPSDTVLVLRDGVAWGYFRHVPGTTRRTASWSPEFRVSREPVMEDEAGSHLPADATAGIGVVPPGTIAIVWRTGFALRMPKGETLHDALGTRGPDPRVQWINRDGFVALATDSLGVVHQPELPGFRTWGADTAWPPRVTAIAGGALAGHRIVLDPEGGGDDAGGTGPSGMRVATVNLDVARALAGMLEAAGAQVVLTRTNDAAVSEMERVQTGEAFGAERFLRIGHAAASPSAGHYYASGGGRRWGAALARACAALGIADSLKVAEASKYVLTQSSAVALYASLARVDTREGEAKLLAPGALRAEAYALFCSLAAEFAPGAAETWTSDSLELRSADGTPRPGVPVRFGGGLLLQSGANGRLRFLRTEPGPMPLEIGDAAFDTHPVLLDSEHGRVLTGTR